MDTTSSSFYLTLPSNACKERFPRNECGSYKIKLAHPIRLKHNYEVALVEMQFTKSWYTLNQKCNEFWCDSGTGFEKYCLKQGFYTDVPHILQHMLDHIKLLDIDLDYNPVTSRVKVYLRNGTKLKLQQGLSDILGLPGNVDIVQTTRGEEAADIRRGMTALYAYSDIVEPQFVGDALVPLLRIIDSKGKHNEIITRKYSRPHYVPVRRNELDIIEINICDNTGEIVSFTSGKLICKLHLRLRQPML